MMSRLQQHKDEVCFVWWGEPSDSNTASFVEMYRVCVIAHSLRQLVSLAHAV